MRILLIEDNFQTIQGLKFLLEHEGFAVTVATDATAALDHLAEHLYDLILLDVGLPHGDGFNLAHKIKNLTPDLPIIFLTARDDEDDVVRGFDLGADDYITKPFRNRELITRIRATLRRHNKKSDVLVCGDLTLNPKARVLKKQGRVIELSALEYKIVELLMVNAGSIITRERLLDEIWDYAGNVVNDNTLTVYIKRIREKLGEDKIRTIKGVGYKMEGGA